MSKRNQHEWDYIASTPKGELGFCRLCNQFRYNTGKPFKMSDRALRKIQRRIENDAFARDARYWRGKIKSADRTLNDRPVDRQAAKSLSHKH